MANKNLIEIEKWIKSNLKKKVSVTQATVITFLMTGAFISTPLFAADKVVNEDNFLVSKEVEDEEAEKIKEKAERLRQLILAKEGNRNSEERTITPMSTNSNLENKSFEDRAISIYSLNGTDRATSTYGMAANGYGDNEADDENKKRNTNNIEWRGSIVGDEMGSTGNAYPKKKLAIDKYGINSVSLGYKTIAGHNSVAIGYFADTAMGYEGATLIGTRTRAGGSQATTVGYKTYAGKQATSIGNDTIALGLSSIAIGSDDIYDDAGTIVYGDKLSEATMKKIFYNKETGQYRMHKAMTEEQFKEKYWNDNSDGTTKKVWSPTLAYAPGAISIGSRSVALGQGSTAMGTLAFALGDNTTALGLRSFADKEGGIAVGEEARSFSENGMAVGNHSESSGEMSSAYGNYARAVGKGSLAIGDTVATNAYVKNHRDFENVIKNELVTEANRDTATNLSRALTTIQNQQAGKSTYFDYKETGEAYITVGGKEVKKTEKIGATKAKPKDYAVALGHLVLSAGTGSIGVGTATFVDGDNSIGIGSLGYIATGAHNSVVVGTAANTHKENSIAIGSNASTTQENAISIGKGSLTKGTSSVALGNKTYVHSNSTVAVGDEARAFGSESIAMGKGAVVGKFNRPDISRNFSNGAYTGNTNVGHVLDKTNNGDINSQNTELLNNKRENTTNSSVAIGYNANAEHYGTAIGRDSYALNTGSVAVGEMAHAAAERSLALGNNSYALGTHASSIGYKSKALGNQTIAMGVDSIATSHRGIAIGVDSKATMFNSVALGYGSKTDYDVDELTKPGWISSGAFSIPATKNVGVISVGSVGGERRVVNVAAGRLGTDAVNVSQLKSLEDRMDFNFGDDRTKKLAYLSTTGGVTAAAEKENDYKAYVRLKTQQLTIKLKQKKGENIPASVLAEINEKVKKYEDMGWPRDKARHLRDKEAAIARATVNDGNYRDQVQLVEAAALADKKLVENQNELEKLLSKSNRTAQDEQKINELKAKIDDKHEGLISVAEIEKIVESNYRNDGAKAENAVAIGAFAKAQSNDAIAIGKEAKVGANSVDAIYIGSADRYPDKKIENITSSVFIGQDNNRIDGEVKESVVIGNDILSENAQGSIAIGGDSSGLGGAHGQGQWRETKISGKGATAIGSHTQATADLATALGARATATQSEGVALGSYSKADTAKLEGTQNKGYLAEANDSGKVWQSTKAAVAVGDVAQNVTRQITGVAAGKEDTDAVNVAQLKKVGNAAKLNYVSIKSTATGNRDNLGASGTNAVAIGPDSTATGNNGIALGKGASSTEQASIAKLEEVDLVEEQLSQHQVKIQRLQLELVHKQMEQHQ